MLPPIAQTSQRLIAVLALGAAALWAQPAFETIHVFKAAGDGNSPRAGLVLDSSGNAYGVTLYGGAFNQGAVYELVPVSGTENWTESVIYSFGATAGDGMNPAGTLIVGGGGVLYGTTIGGGTASAGTVFELTPPVSPGGSWTETVLYNFGGSPDGAAPHAGLLAGTGGILYGTTAYGGNENVSCPSGCGTVFSLTPGTGGDWTESQLYSFSGTDGANPFASLTAGSSGIYGTTVNGALGFGEVFTLPNEGGFSVAYEFTGGADGANPYAALTPGAKGIFYGTAENGGGSGMGVIFSVTTHGIEKVLHAFSGSADGANPVAGLLLDGELLYGAAALGGSQNDGTLFRQRLTSPATGFKVLHTFNGARQSANPLATPILAPSEALLGTAEPAQDLASGASPDAADGGSGYVYCTKNPPACGN